MTIEGIPNQLYRRGMRLYQQSKYFALTTKKDKEIDKVAKDLNFSNTNIEKYLTKRFALWLVLRSTDDNTLHGSGRRIENASEEITIQIEKEQEANENLNIYLYIIQDVQINFEDGRFKEKKSSIEFPNYTHSTIICGQTGVFENIVILCPTIKWNKAYKNRN